MNDNLSKSYIRNVLFRNSQIEDLSNSYSNKYIFMESIHPSTATRYLIENESGLKKKLINFAFRHKEFIKHIPIIGKKAIRIKTQMVKKIMHNSSDILDVEPLFGLYNTDFPGEIYKLLLGRLIDEAGLKECIKLMRTGASKGALVYIIAKSAEFKNRFQIKNIKLYRKEYKKYLSKQRVSKIPIINRITPIFTLKSQFSELYDRLEQSEHIMKNLLVENKSLLYIVKDEQKRLLENVCEKLDDQSELASSLSEKIANYAYLLDTLSFTTKEIPNRYISDGAIKEQSYLKKATENVDVSSLDQYEEKDKFYYLLANLFRGDTKFVKNTQSFYLKYVQDAYAKCDCKPFIDIGSGRGEFLESLKDLGAEGIGVDYNRASAEVAIKKGLNVKIDLAQNYLLSLDDNSLSGVSMFQVAEHISFDEMFSLCYIISSKISKGGCFIMETMNPYCFCKFGNFKIDPSHIEFPSPDAFKLLLELCGFSKVILEFYGPLADGVKTINTLANYEGYCAIAIK